MGRMQSAPEALRDATEAGKSELAFTSPQYRLYSEQATSLGLSIADMPCEYAAPILWAALDDFHRQGMPGRPIENLMAHATAWADWATENERKAYAVAAVRRMNPATREAFRVYLAGGA